MILNQDLEFQNVDPKVKAAFVGGQAQKRLLPAGLQLYKFTSYDLFYKGAATPWWSSVEPITASDTGLEVLLQRSKSLGIEPSQFSRARNAVTNQWNSMTGLLLAGLTKSVYGFVGPVAHQKLDERPEFNKVVFIGGAIQLWIPNLTPNSIRKA